MDERLNPVFQDSSAQSLEIVRSHIAYTRERIRRLQIGLFDSEVGVVLLLCSQLAFNPPFLEVAYSDLTDTAR